MPRQILTIEKNFLVQLPPLLFVFDKKKQKYQNLGVTSAKRECIPLIRPEYYLVFWSFNVKNKNLKQEEFEVGLKSSGFWEEIQIPMYIEPTLNQPLTNFVNENRNMKVKLRIYEKYENKDLKLCGELIQEMKCGELYRLQKEKREYDKKGEEKNKNEMVSISVNNSRIEKKNKEIDIESKIKKKKEKFLDETEGIEKDPPKKQEELFLKKNEEEKKIVSEKVSQNIIKNTPSNECVNKTLKVKEIEEDKKKEKDKLTEKEKVNESEKIVVEEKEKAWNRGKKKENSIKIGDKIEKDNENDNKNEDKKKIENENENEKIEEKENETQNQKNIGRKKKINEPKKIFNHKENDDLRKKNEKKKSSENKIGKKENFQEIQKHENDNFFLHVENKKLDNILFLLKESQKPLSPFDFQILVFQYFKKIENRMDSLENRMDSLENRMDSLENQMKKYQGFNYECSLASFLNFKFNSEKKKYSIRSWKEKSLKFKLPEKFLEFLFFCDKNKWITEKEFKQLSNTYIVEFNFLSIIEIPETYIRNPTYCFEATTKKLKNNIFKMLQLEKQLLLLSEKKIGIELCGFAAPSISNEWIKKKIEQYPMVFTELGKIFLKEKFLNVEFGNISILKN